MKKMLSIIAVVFMIVVLCSGCTESEKVRYNVSKEADNFNVHRRLAVINTVNGQPVFEMVGRLSVVADEEDDQLEVLVEVADGKYKKHIIGLNDATTMYVVEDIEGAKVSKYEYEINYLPHSLLPYKFTFSN